MDQSKSSEHKDVKVVLPRRSFSTEFFVGLFTMLGVGCIGYLAIGLGGLELVDTGTYEIKAEFDNISGLKYGASVEVAGVPVGQVARISLKDPAAVVTLKLNKNFQVRDDDVASIRTKGIIGDRYIKISRGSSSTFIAPDGKMTETESVVDIEDIIGKIVHSLGSDKKDEEK